jgi:hypothetical protein
MLAAVRTVFEARTGGLLLAPLPAREAVVGAGFASHRATADAPSPARRRHDRDRHRSSAHTIALPRLVPTPAVPNCRAIEPPRSPRGVSRRAPSRASSVQRGRSPDQIRTRAIRLAPASRARCREPSVRKRVVRADHVVSRWNAAAAKRSTLRANGASRGETRHRYRRTQASPSHEPTRHRSAPGLWSAPEKSAWSRPRGSSA